jgi:ABC-type multidrug transport system fused ATPase/permease subunit
MASEKKMKKNTKSSSSSSSKDKARKKMKKDEIKKFLKAELKKELKPMIIGGIAMICSTASNSAVPRLLGKVLDKNAAQASSSSSPTNNNNNSYNTNHLLLIVLGGGISSFLRTTMLNRAQDGIASSLRSQLFRTLLMDRDVEWYNLDSNSNKDEKVNKDQEEDTTNNLSTDKTEKKDTTASSSSSSTSSSLSHSPAAIQSILTKDVETVASTITTTIANTFRSTCSILFATTNMFYINSNLLTMSLSIVPIIGSTAVILNKFVKQITCNYDSITQQAEVFATERLNHISTVKTSNREMDEIKDYEQMQSDARKLSRKSSLAKGLFMGFMFSSSSSALVLLFHLGGRSVRSGKMTFGELKTFATYTFMLGLGTSGLMKGLGQIAQGMVCAERIYNMMDANDEEHSKDTATTTAAAVDKVTVDHDSINTVSLSKVNFAYATDLSKEILKDITMSINRGQVVALAGANGSGKSTLASLLVALYKPQNGVVTVNDQEGKETDFYSLDRQTQSSLVQLVPQQPVMFDMSIRKNITYTNPKATEEEIKQALDESNCTTFISKLNDGVEYNVGRNGCKLSGGQRQRLALARALLCDPALLILDEPNSSMDAEGNNAVADAVRNCRTGDADGNNKRGLLLITHRVSSLELADLIVVLKDGKIAEQGTYDDLVNNKESALCQLMPDLQ